MYTPGVFRADGGVVAPVVSSNYGRQLIWDSNDGWLRIGQNQNYAAAFSNGIHTPGKSFLGGEVGIGSAPVVNQRLRVYSTGTDSNHFPLAVISTDGVYSLFTIRNSTNTAVTGFIAAGSWSYGSDERLKEEIVDETDGIEQIRNVRPIRFRYIGAPMTSRGFLAQQLQPHFPDLIDEREDGFLGVRATELLPVIVRALQQIDERLTNLEQTA